MSEFVPANRLYDVATRTTIVHPAHQVTDEQVHRALESEGQDREIRTDGGYPTSGTDRFYDDSDSGVEWATPGYIWRPLADALGGFDLDPASGAESHPIATKRYTKADNGLARNWTGHVWVNPPYGRDVNEEWAKKIAGEAKREEVETITALVPAATGAEWYQDYYGTADIETFIRGRVRFSGSDRDPSFWSVIVSYGSFPEPYIAALQSLGEVRQIPEKPTQQALISAIGGGTPCAIRAATEQDGDS